MTDTNLLDAVFGPGEGQSIEERALSSTKEFVRSQIQLSFRNSNSTAPSLTAYEALSAYGWDILKEVATFGAAILVAHSTEPYKTIEERIDELGLQLTDVFKRLRFKNDFLQAFHDRRQLPMEAWLQLAQILALDIYALSLKPGAEGDKKLAVRMRKYHKDDVFRFGASLVFSLTEAAWITKRQIELSEALNRVRRNNEISPWRPKPNTDLGDAKVAPWIRGFVLARETRRALELANKPIKSMRDLVEQALQIPIIQMDLPKDIAGATVANGRFRGIVVNTLGQNQNVWVRRMTIAHELGHLLWDPDPILDSVVVDRYDEISGNYFPAHVGKNDMAEKRANGFAVAFLAPQEQVVERFDSILETNMSREETLRVVMEEFGISFTALTTHLSNAGRLLDNLRKVRSEPSDDWKASEEDSLAFFEPNDVPISRRGNFAHLVAKAFDNKLLSEDSARLHLGCSKENIPAALKSGREWAPGA